MLTTQRAVRQILFQCTAMHFSQDPRSKLHPRDPRRKIHPRDPRLKEVIPGASDTQSEPHYQQIMTETASKVTEK